jgi:hypothetical protein
MRNTASTIVYLQSDNIKNFKDSESPEDFLLEKGIWIQDRFNWATFFFQFFWFFSKALWTVGLINMAFFAVLYAAFFYYGVPLFIIGISCLIGASYFAFEASYFQMQACRRRGFLPQLITRAKNQEDARYTILHSIQKDL